MSWTDLDNAWLRYTNEGEEEKWYYDINLGIKVNKMWLNDVFITDRDQCIY